MKKKNLKVLDGVFWAKVVKAYEPARCVDQRERVPFTRNRWHKWKDFLVHREEEPGAKLKRAEKGFTLDFFFRRTEFLGMTRRLGNKYSAFGNKLRNPE